MVIDVGSFTPPPSFNSRPSYAPKSCKSENRKNCSSQFSDQFHVIHKVPAGDSPYVRAKRAQLIDKDPTRSISLFWRAINSGDRVDSALKDMAVAMKQLDRSDEAIEAIRSFRHLCSKGSQESLDNILIELYKHSGRLEDQVEILQEKLKRIEEEASFGGKRTKMARSQGKKIHITIEQEYSRLLGNLAWVHLEQNNYKVAEEYYRKALSIELDRNKQCNLAVCLMYMNRIREAKMLLQSIKASSANPHMDESYAKSYERAHELLAQIDYHGGLHSFMKAKEKHNEEERDFDCQSQLDYIDNMRPIGDANISEKTLHTPADCKWKAGAGSETSGYRLFSQPINRRDGKVTQPRRYLMWGCGAKEKELNGDNTTSLPCYLQFRNEALSTDESEKSNASPSKELKADQHSSDGIWQQNLFLRDSTDKRESKSPMSFQQAEALDPCNGDNVEQAKDCFFSNKSWDDKEEDYLFLCNGEKHFSPGAQFSSKSSSVRRSLPFDHEEKQDACKSDSLLLPKSKSLLAS